MRLTTHERGAIADAARDTLARGRRICLFGSRVDDQARGGDIDLLVELPPMNTPRPCRLGLALWESERHAGVLADALSRWAALPVMPALQGIESEPFESWPMRDRLDRLRKPGYLDVDGWLRWRELRNRLAHEYPDAPVIRYAQLLAAIDGARELFLAYRAWAGRLSQARWAPLKRRCQTCGIALVLHPL